MSDKLARMGVEVNAETDGLQQGLDQATSDLDRFEQSLNSMSLSALEANLAALETQLKSMNGDWNKLSVSIDSAKARLSAKGMSSSAIQADPKIMSMQSSFDSLENNIAQVESKIGMLKSAIGSIESKPIEKLKSAFKEVASESEKSSGKSDFSMKKTIKTATRFGALLLGMRTIYSIITRAAQAYIGQNEKLQIQINSMFVALGSLLAPAIDLVVGWMTELVKWVIVAAAYTIKFINVIFGLSIPIKLTAQLNKNLKQTSKELSNLASFDEITILQDPASTSTTPQIDLTPYDMSSALAGVEEFGKNLQALQPIIQPLIIILGILTAAVIAMNIAMAVNPIVLIVYVVMAVIAAIVLLIVYWDDITKAVISFSGKTIGVIVNLVNWLLTAFSNVVTAISKPFIDAFNGIKKVIGDVWNWILNLFSAGGKIFAGVVDGISNIFVGVVNALITGINKLIAAPFNIINGLLNTIRSISILGFKPFIGLWSVNPLPVPQIPKLATGAVATGPTLAQIGEGRYDEAVIPLGSSPQFTGMKQDIADAVIQGMSGIGGGEAVVILQVDGATLGRASIKNINKLQRQAGKNLLKI